MSMFVCGVCLCVCVRVTLYTNMFTSGAVS